MVSHFGGRQGMSHDCLNSQPSQPQSAIASGPQNLSGDDSELPAPIEQAPIEQVRRRQGITPERADRNSAITSLGDSIKEGLSSLGASFGTNSGGGQNMERMLALHTQLLQENKAKTAELLKLANAAFDFFIKNRNDSN